MSTDIKNKIDRLRPFFYGLAELGPASLDIFLKVYLLIYFNLVLSVPASLGSLAIGLSVFWDAAIDPWIGIYSDRYYMKHKNRKNLLLFSTFFISILFYFLWRFKFEQLWVNVALLFLISSLLNSGISLFSVPYFAVANDLEDSNKKRKVWIGWRLAFFNLGYLVGLAVPAFFLTRVDEQLKPQAYLQAVDALTILTLILTVLSVYLTYLKSKAHFRHAESHQPIQFRVLVKDFDFLQIVLAFFVVSSGLGLNSSLALYYYKIYMQYSEKQTQSILIGFLIMLILSIPFWIYVTHRFNKKTLLKVASVLIGLLMISVFPFLKEFNFIFVFSIASVVGGFLLGASVVLEIELSDLLKLKEDRFKQSVSAQYLGFWKMASKSSRAVAIGLSGPILDLSAGRPQLLAYFFGGGVGIFFLGSALILSISVSKKNEG